jgi:hypothetical protein
MISSFSFKQRRLNKGKQFQEFVFIGKTSDKLKKKSTQQLQLSRDNSFISEATVEDSLVITQIRTSTNINDQLKNLNIKPGAIVKLVSKTNNGSVIMSLGNQLIGISAEIAREIVTTPAT